MRGATLHVARVFERAVGHRSARRTAAHFTRPACAPSPGVTRSHMCASVRALVGARDLGLQVFASALGRRRASRRKTARAQCQRRVLAGYVGPVLGPLRLRVCAWARERILARARPALRKPIGRCCGDQQMSCIVESCIDLHTMLLAGRRCALARPASLTPHPLSCTAPTVCRTPCWATRGPRT